MGIRQGVIAAAEQLRGLTVLTDEEARHVIATVPELLVGRTVSPGGFSEYCPVTVPMLQYYGFRPWGGGGWESPNKVFLVRIGADKASVIAGSHFRDIPGPRHLQDLRNMAQVLGDPLPDFVELRLDRRDVLALREELQQWQMKACNPPRPVDRLEWLDQMRSKLSAAAGIGET